MHILFCRRIWAELSHLFWTFLCGTFFPGGGGVHVHPVHPPPPAYAPVLVLVLVLDLRLPAVNLSLKTKVTLLSNCISLVLIF